jgi:hypothetical protein
LGGWTVLSHQRLIDQKLPIHVLNIWRAPFSSWMWWCNVMIWARGFPAPGIPATQHTWKVHKVCCSVWKSRNFTSDYLICIWLLDLPHITPTGIYVDAPALGTGQYMLCYLWRGWCQLRYRQGGFTCLRQCIITTEYRVKISDFGSDTTLFWGNISLARPGFD